MGSIGTALPSTGPAAAPRTPVPGAAVAELRRRVDTSLEVRLRGALAALGKASGTSSCLQEILEAFAESDVLARSLNTLSRRMRDCRERLDGVIRLAVDDINRLASQIAAANGEMADGGAALERRGLLLRELSERIAFTAVETFRGEVDVRIGTAFLVVGTESVEFAVREYETGVHGVVTPGQAAVPVSDGRLRGLLDVRDVILAGALRDLDRLGERTLEEDYREWEGKRVVEAAEAQDRLEIRTLLVRQLERQRARCPGASIGEEAASMIRDQRAFQAAARSVGVVDELLDTLARGI